MALDDFQSEVIKFMGRVDEAVANLQRGQREQGERIGSLETRFQAHEVQFANRPGNSNGKREKVMYGGAGAGVFGLIELLRHLFSGG